MPIQFTDPYDLPYPETADLAKLGAINIQQLAEATRDRLAELWAALEDVVAPTYAVGDWINPRYVALTAQATVIDTLYFSRLPVPQDHDIDRIAFEVTASTLDGGGGGNDGSSGTLRMGIYTDADGRPDDLVVDGGTSNATVGAKTVNIAEALEAGYYWACVQPGGIAGVATLRCVSGVTDMPGSAVAVRYNGASRANAGALPASAGAVAMTSGAVVPVGALRVA